MTLDQLIRSLNSLSADAREVLSKIKDIATVNDNVTLTFYDGTTITLPGYGKVVSDLQNQINSFISGARREYPFINVLANSYMLDTNGDGVLDSPLSGWVAGDYSIVEKKVYAWNDSSLPDAVKQAFYDTDIVYNNANGNPTTANRIPFNVQKFVFSGTDYTTGVAFFIPGNPVKGKHSFGALAVVTTTGNINIEGIGDLEPNTVYKYVVFRTGQYRVWNIDVPVIKVKGQVDIWVIGPWMVPGKFSDTPGVDKGHPLFVYPSGKFHS